MSQYPKVFKPITQPPPPRRTPCSTARRLAYLRKLCGGATCATSKRMVERCKAAWWPADNAEKLLTSDGK